MMIPDRRVRTEDLCARARSALEARREALNREIHAIPMPIPACDVNFNRLLEERARVVDELQQLARLERAKAPAEEIRRFVAAATGLDAPSRDRVLAMLADPPAS